MGWTTGWTYRKSHIVNPASGAGQNYQKRIVVHYGVGVDNDENVYLSGKCRTDFGDIRFTNNSGAFLLDYWLDKKINSDYAIFWVKILNDLNTYDQKIYIYYGNAGAVSVASGDATFIFFDDFEVNLNRWSALGTTGLRFSGSNNLGSPTGFGTIGDFDGYSPFTLECWFRTSGTGEQPLISRMNQAYMGGNGRGYCLFLYNDKIMYELRNTIYTPANEIFVVTNVRSVNDGNWHHVVATYDGSQQASGVHIYIDGTEEPFTTTTNTLTDTISNPFRFQVATYAGWAYLTGDIDEIVVYTSVLSLSDVIARYNNGEGTDDILTPPGDIYTHWPMDEGSGTDVIDVLGHPDRNLWLATTSGPLPEWVAGKVGAPTVSTDHAYSGLKGIKIPATTNPSAIFKVSGGSNIAIHTHCYDLVSSDSELFQFLTTAGLGHDAAIGVFNDLSEYEYNNGTTVYLSGITRTVGWHEFVTRVVSGSKQFLIDEITMPNTGLEDSISLFFLGTSAPPVICNSYWDSFFIRKYVSPEPAHGVWGTEETGSGVTTYIAEEIETTNFQVALTIDDIIYPTNQKAISAEDSLSSLIGSNHLPDLSEDLLWGLDKSPHVPDLSEDLIIALTKKIMSVEDLINTLTEAPHQPNISEEMVIALLQSFHVKIQAEDTISALLAKRTLSTDEIILTILAKRLLQGEDIIYERPLLYRSRMMAFPIFGGSHVIQVKGDEE